MHVNLVQAGFVFIKANVKKWGLAPSVGTLAPPPAYGSELRQGHCRFSLAVSSLSILPFPHPLLFLHHSLLPTFHASRNTALPQMLLGNEKMVYIPDKTDGNAAQMNGHPAWDSVWRDPPCPTSTPHTRAEARHPLSSFIDLSFEGSCYRQAIHDNHLGSQLIRPHLPHAFRSVARPGQRLYE